MSSAAIVIGILKVNMEQRRILYWTQEGLTF